MERIQRGIVTSRQLCDQLVQVYVDDEAVGFVERAWPVFIALHGSHYDRALEVAQTITFDDAMAALAERIGVVDSINSELAKFV